MKREDRFDRGELKGVGRRLRLLRVARGWSLRKLSEVSEISVAAIRKIELGESNPSLLTVLALVEALDEPVDRLVDRVLGSGERTRLVRAAAVGDAGLGPSLSNGLTNRRMAGRHVTLSDGEALTPDDATPARPLFGYVLDGEVVLSWDRAREETCRSGDSFHILKPADLTVSAASNGAKLVVVEGLDEA